MSSAAVGGPDPAAFVPLASQAILPEMADAAPGPVAQTTTRACDVVAAAALLILTLPVLLLAALAVRLDGPGAVLCRAPGLAADDGSVAPLQFRCTAAPSSTGAIPLTWLGALLWRSRISDLPGLLSVVRGEVALAQLLRAWAA